jgi:NhaP-type Na+/H+ or K+/H+ antiporter
MIFVYLFSSLLVLVGIAFGALIDFVEPSVFPEFGPDLFFHWLLPPIILEAAYSLYHRAFLDNLRAILLFAVVVSAFYVSLFIVDFVYKLSHLCRELLSTFC